MRKLSLCFVLVLGVSGAGIPAFSQTPGVDEIVLGALLPLTGSLSSSGEAGDAAVQMAIEDVNSYFATKGLPYHASVIIEDTGTDPVQALAALQSLANQGIRLVVGPYVSSTVEAVKDYADANGILILSPASSATSLAIPDDNIYRLAPDDTNQGLAIASYLNRLNVKTVIPIYMDDTFGNSLSDSTRQKFQEIGGTYPAGVKFDPNASDLSPYVQSLKEQVEQAVGSAGADAVAVHLIAFEQTIDIFNLASGDPVLSSVRWFGNDGITENEAILNDPVAAAFAVATNFASPIARRDDSFDAIIPTFPITQQFRRRLEARLGSRGDEFAVNAYDAMFASALTYQYGHMPVDLESLKSAFDFATSLYIGYNLKIEINEAGDRSKGAYGFYKIKRLSNGAYRWYVAASFRFADGAPQGARPLLVSGFELPEDMADFTMAVLVPLTGDLAVAGRSALRAIQLAAEDFNAFLAEEGVPGRLQLQVEDTATDPATALNRLQAIAQSGASKVVVGPFSSAAMQAVQDFANNNGMILLSPSSTAASLAVPNDNIYRMTLDNLKEGQAIAALMEEVGIQAVVPVQRNDVFGNDLANAFALQFEGAGGVVLEGVSYAPNTTNFSGVVASLHDKVAATIAQYGSRAVAVELISFEEAELLFTLANQDEILRSVQWVGCDSNARLETLFANTAALEFAAETHFVAPVFAPDFLVEFRLDPPMEIVRADFESFIQQTLERNGMPPNVYDYASYDCLWLAIYAQLNAGLGVDDLDTLKNRLQLVATPFIGFTGLTDFNEAGDKNYGVFGFSALFQDEAGYSWDYVGSYRFTVREGGVFFWVNQGLPSGLPNWVLYR
ncbi:MAG: penicillin-binding protein activator [bacterium]